jgi:hypothetical protein
MQKHSGLQPTHGVANNDQNALTVIASNDTLARAHIFTLDPPGCLPAPQCSPMTQLSATAVARAVVAAFRNPALNPNLDNITAFGALKDPGCQPAIHKETMHDADCLHRKPRKQQCYEPHPFTGPTHTSSQPLYCRHTREEFAKHMNKREFAHPPL